MELDCIHMCAQLGRPSFVLVAPPSGLLQLIEQKAMAPADFQPTVDLPRAGFGLGFCALITKNVADLLPHMENYRSFLL